MNAFIGEMVLIEKPDSSPNESIGDRNIIKNGVLKVWKKSDYQYSMLSNFTS